MQLFIIYLLPYLSGQRRRWLGCRLPRSGSCSRWWRPTLSTRASSPTLTKRQGSFTRWVEIFLSFLVFFCGFFCRIPIRVQSHAPSIRSHRGTKVFSPDFQPMRVSEDPVCIDTGIFRQNPVFTSLHSRSPWHVAPPLYSVQFGSKLEKNVSGESHIFWSEYAILPP